MSTPQRSFKRAAALIAATIALLALAAAPAVATPVTAAEDAADWLTGELASDPDGSYFEIGFGGSPTDPDAGLTADGVLALVAADDGTPGSYGADFADMTDWLSDSSNLSAYVGAGGMANDLNAGPLAKVIVALLAAGEDPTNVASRDLVDQLEGLEQGSLGADPGRFSDQGTDNSGTVGQALAIIGLDEADPSYTNANGSTLPDAVDYLIDQQCTATGFEGAFSWALNDTGNCTTNADVDTTAIAAQALMTSSDIDAQLAAIAAVDWLVNQQTLPAGYWQSNACTWPSFSPSVNSTALAVQALALDGGYGSEVSDATSWLEGTANTGPTDYGLPACGASGAGDVRATVQGIPGLLELSYPDLVQ